MDSIIQDSSNLDKLHADAKIEGEASRPLFSPEKKEGKKRGPYKKKDGSFETPKSSAGPAPQPGMVLPPGFDFKESCRGVFSVISSMLVRITKCDDVALSKEEIQALGDSWGAVSMQYAPDFLAKHGMLLGACLTTGVVAFRISQVMEIEIQKRQALQAANEGRQNAENSKPAQAETVTNLEPQIIGGANVHQI